MLYTGFTNTSQSQQTKIRGRWQTQERWAERTDLKNDLRVLNQKIGWVHCHSRHRNTRCWRLPRLNDITKTWTRENLSRACISARIKKKRQQKKVWREEEAKGCGKMDRRRWENNVSRSTWCRHLTGGNRRALKKDSNRNSDVSGQSESESRRTCTWRSRHLSRQGYFKQRCSHTITRQDESSNLHVARATPERR